MVIYAPAQADVAHALLRAVLALLPTRGLAPDPRVHTSVDAARMSACATSVAARLWLRGS